MTAKAAIVFGGSRSIAAATALRLAKVGFDVALTYPARPEAGFVTGSAITINGGRLA
jgi:3-oxoacyl-[acyl-carrier protein] reductase